MKLGSIVFAAILLLAVACPALLQAEEEHPSRAACQVCSQNGESHGPEKVKGMSAYEGKTYYFCSKGCKEAFDADPEGYMPQVFPRPAPPLNSTDLTGQSTGLEEYEGSVLLLDFWATWCKPCVEIMPELQKLQAAHAEKGLRVLGISIDEDPKKVEKFLAKRPVDYRIAIDDPESPTWEAYGVKVVPTSYLIDRTGKIVARWVGKPDLDEVQKAIVSSLETPVEND